MNKHPLKIYMFYCSNSIDTQELSKISKPHSGEYKTIVLPCSGKIDILYLIKAFETGADGIVVITCKQGECKYLEGNMRAAKRVAAINKLLQEIGFIQNRMIVIEKNDAGIERVIKEINSFISNIESSSQNILNNHNKVPVS